MTLFDTNYKKLNTKQREAVDTIDGPVMVVAGPGTGKTQLLSMRVANILRKTDTLPNNILCLTFTESAASEMRERLIKMMGSDGHKVAIHTFHSFGVEIINHNPEYFYKGANFRPSDDLSTREILEPLFEDLSHKDPLQSKMNNNFTYLQDTQKAISNLKKAGLTPDELIEIIEHNQEFLYHTEPIIAKAFNIPRLNKKDIPQVQKAADHIEDFKPTSPPKFLQKMLHQIFISELNRDLDQAREQNSTKPLTAWRNRWLEKDHNNNFVFKDQKRNQKLRSLSKIYEQYMLKMQENELYDFDDMILRPMHALEFFPELRYNLQEQFLYVLVDEFQDTNGAQLRLLKNLLDNEASNGRPNVMVVGDDDQAIYAFQGADLSNILDFHKMYKNPKIITLSENYRSGQLILEQSRNVITQGEQRLENTLDNIDKTLNPNNHKATSSELHQFVTPNEEYDWVANKIQQLVEQGTNPKDIAVLARNHRQLIKMLPYLNKHNIEVNYEKRYNLLESEHIKALITIAQAIKHLSNQEMDEANQLMPKLLSFDFWNISPTKIWEISIKASKDKVFWLETMNQDEDLKNLADFLIQTSQQAEYQSLEDILDIIIGQNKNQEEQQYISPFKNHYFSKELLDTDPATYLSRLNDLSTLRQLLREYRPDKTITLNDFVHFIDTHQRNNLPINSLIKHHTSDQSITLMSAHKAKGLEFDTVFITQCQEDIWGQAAKNKSSNIPFPYNLPIEPAGQTLDDNLRLFFVAMTRACNHLYLSYYQKNDQAKSSQIISFLDQHTDTQICHQEAPIQKTIDLIETNWQDKHTRPIHQDRKQLLAPQLEKYQLSSTHLNNFIDIVNAGPQIFLLNNLLRFPQAMSKEAIFGSIVHNTIQQAHIHLAIKNEHQSHKNILKNFHDQLEKTRLNSNDKQQLSEKGSEILPIFIEQRQQSFNKNQKVEYKLRNIILNQARLTGAVDLIEINPKEKSIIVTDYKTGKPPKSWQGRADYEKVKLHKYRQQLMMYKILIESSRDFEGYTVTQGILEFVEPDQNNQIQRLELFYNQEDQNQFKQLINRVWHHIINLDLPTTDHYPNNYKGLQQFEKDLLNDQTQAQTSKRLE